MRFVREDATAQATQLRSQAHPSAMCFTLWLLVGAFCVLITGGSEPATSAEVQALRMELSAAHDELLLEAGGCPFEGGACHVCTRSLLLLGCCMLPFIFDDCLPTTCRLSSWSLTVTYSEHHGHAPKTQPHDPKPAPNPDWDPDPVSGKRPSIPGLRKKTMKHKAGSVAFCVLDRVATPAPGVTTIQVQVHVLDLDTFETQSRLLR